MDKSEGIECRIYSVGLASDGGSEMTVEFYGYQEGCEWSLEEDYIVISKSDLALRDAAIRREALEEAAKVASSCCHCDNFCESVLDPGGDHDCVPCSEAYKIREAIHALMAAVEEK